MQAVTAFLNNINVPSTYEESLQSGYFFTYSEKHFGLEAPLPLALAVATAVLYVVLVFIIWPLMRPTLGTTAYSIWKTLRFWHNVLLCIFSGVAWTSTLYFMYENGELDFATKGMQPMLCNDKMPQWLWILNLVFVVSKIYEWLDTMFLVLLKPQVPKSFLHLYHHATTFWLFLLVTNFPSTMKMGMLLNGFVHFLMYWHYATPFPSVVVPLITASQIGQLAFVIWVWGATPSRCPQHSEFSTKYPYEFISPYLMAPVYLIFFVHFFIKRFLFGGGKKSGGKKGAAPSPTASPLMTKSQSPKRK